MYVLFQLEWGTYTEALVGSLQRLNPILITIILLTAISIAWVFSSLICYDENGLPQPELATKWGISYDGLSYNFDLNNEAKWYDGTPVTSADVVFTIDLMRSAESVLPEDGKNLKQYSRILGDNGIQFRLSKPFAPFMDYLSFGILPKHLLENLSYQQILSSSFNLGTNRSGPFQFERLSY